MVRSLLQVGPVLDTPSTYIVKSRLTGRRCLMVLGDQVASYPLPDAGTVTIGRSSASDIRIDERSISRNHALLRVGETVSIEDLASANGTQVAGAPIPARTPTLVRYGEIIEVGEVSLLVQHRGESTQRRIWSRADFESRLAQVCNAASMAFCVGFVHCDAVPPNETVTHAAARLREADTIAEYGPGEYVLLLPALPLVAADALVRELAGDLHDRGVRAQIAVAEFPTDARTGVALVARAAARARPSEPVGANGFVVADPAMIQLRRVIDRVASGALSVLLLGETGVGKEGLAELVHARSPRSGKPFLRLNCSAFTETLLESELFGHEKGAFTGAAATKLGLLETAQGGTVFLDEIGEISPGLQVKLLRVLEDRIVMRVGGLKGTTIDVRFVAATNRDLEEEVARGRFRQDLYYRLAGITLMIPPLRDRVIEIAQIARAFIVKACAQTGRKVQLGQDALEALEGYAWPGNIRELRNVVERAVLLCTDNVIRREHLQMERLPTERASVVTEATPPPSAPVDEPVTPPLEALYRGDCERDRVIAALRASHGNQTKAAELLGMSRRTLINRVEEYKLPRPRKGR